MSEKLQKAQQLEEEAKRLRQEVEQEKLIDELKGFSGALRSLAEELEAIVQRLFPPEQGAERPRIDEFGQVHREHSHEMATEGEPQEAQEEYILQPGEKPADEDAPNTCENCGQGVTTEMHYCIYCGEPLKEAVTIIITIELA